GDSLLFAAEEDCDGCTSAAVIFGEQVEEVRGLPVEVHNLTMHNSLDSAGLRMYLEKGAKIGRVAEDVFRAVASADIVSVTVGFNDFGSPASASAVTPFATNLDAILGRVRALREGRATTVLVTQIYNNGGAAWTPIVEAANEVICDLAAKHDAICVDIYHPFNGPDGSGSPMALGYLGADQTHPSQRGMEVIAEAMAAAE
ncbi:MAG TPA: SGNH/GDSL hydrolase family protein, partial [Candidatus Limnocylindrales bacterium]